MAREVLDANIEPINMLDPNSYPAQLRSLEKGINELAGQISTLEQLEVQNKDAFVGAKRAMDNTVVMAESLKKMKTLAMEKRNALFVVRNKVENERIARMEVGPAMGEAIATFAPRQRMEFISCPNTSMPTSMPSPNQTDVAEPDAEPGVAAELPSTLADVNMPGASKDSEDK